VLQNEEVTQAEMFIETSQGRKRKEVDGETKTAIVSLLLCDSSC
jgi:hypothetical protein